MRGAVRAVTLLLERIGREANSRWGVDSGLARLVFAIPLVLGPCLVLLRYAYFPGYMMVLGEDRLFEWAQVALFLMAAFLSYRIASVHLADRRYLMTAVFILLAGCMFFSAGEEISWGQRLFGWETPEAWRERNIQEETTIHNLSPLRWGFHALTLLIGIYGAYTPFLYEYVVEARRRLQEPFVPPLFLTSCFLVVAAGMVIYLSQVFLGDVVIIKFSEYWETCLAVGITWHLCLLSNGRPMRRVADASEREPRRSLQH
jgi:hypothetical protein